RIVNILVIAALVIAATTVYKIKFDSTLQAEKVAKLHNELRKERDAIASLKAEWARRDTPSRIQALADRFLKLQPVKPTQFGNLDHLPPRPPDAPANSDDPIAALIASLASARASHDTTGSLPARPAAQAR
ncbi:MAG: cell division protein FtsL, partial [Bradyrhizobium sp.]